MKRTKGQLYAAALALSVTLSGCGPAPAVTPTATPAPTPTPSAAPVEAAFALPYSPGDSFDPIEETSRVNLTFSPLVYQGLFSLDRQFRAQNALCASYTVSEDGLEWIFTLADRTFSDASPLSPAQVVSSLDRARKSTRYSARLADVRKVRADGNGGVVVTLSRPNGALPVLLDIPVVKAAGGEWPLGTGDYSITERDGELSLTAQADATTPLDTIPLRPVGDSDDLIYAFDAGEVSLVDTDVTGANALGYSGRFETTDYPTASLLYVGFNAKTGSCKDDRVRRALARALDREDVTTRLLAGHGVASALPVHPYAEEYDVLWAGQLAYNLDAAKELLSQAGWTLDGEGHLKKGRSGLTLKLLVNQDNSHKIGVAEALGKSLESLGCAITLEKLPWDDFIKALESREFDLYLGETALTADFDLEPLLGSDGALNYGGYADRELDDRMAARRAAMGEERKTAASAIYERLAETAPIVPLCFKNGSLLTQWGRVSGAAPTQRNVFAGLGGWRVRQ